MAAIEKEVRSLLGHSAWCSEFASLIERPKKDARTPADVTHNLDATLEKLYTGTRLKLKAEQKKPCQICCQLAMSDNTVCVGCRGVGMLRNGTRCSMCGGAGKLPNKRCTNPKCHNRHIKEQHFPLVEIPPGAMNGHKIVLAGLGNTTLEEPPLVGDIVCTVIEKPHPDFKRCWNDLYLIKSINITQALCGCSFILKHLDGRKLKIKSKPGAVIRPGDMKVVKNEGMPIMGSKRKAKGDLIILFNVTFPDIINKSSVGEIEALLPKKKAVKISEELDDYNLSVFDPAEQVYPVPKRQSELDESPMKQQNETGQKTVPTCAQQ